MKRFAKFVGMLPFGGKITIRPIVFRFYQSKTKAERRKNYVPLIGLLIGLVLAHAVQAKMGIRGLSFHAPVLAKAVFCLYAVTNISVTLTQIYLAFRVTVFLFKGLYPKNAKRYAKWTDREIITMMCVTWGGQIVFMILFLVYMRA